MLIIRRKAGESITIDNVIVIKVNRCEFSENEVELAINAPREMIILRGDSQKMDKDVPHGANAERLPVRGNRRYIAKAFRRI